MTDDELADVVLDRLAEFGPAVVIKPADRFTPSGSVEVHITMCRTPCEPQEVKT